MNALETTGPTKGPFDDPAGVTKEFYRMVTLRVAQTGALHVQLPTPGGDQPYASFNVHCTPALTTWVKKQPHVYGSLSGSGKGYVKGFIRVVDVKAENIVARPASPSAIPSVPNPDGFIRLQIHSAEGPNYNVINGHDMGCDVILASQYAVGILKAIGG